MVIADILHPDRIALGPECASKKRALELLSAQLAAGDESLASRFVFNQLCGRERLGSTGMGDGVALPHCRLPGIECTIGALLRVGSPVDFDAADGQGVDLLFGLAVPEACTDEHLDLLAQLAELFSSVQVRERLRNCTSEDDAFAIVTGLPIAA